MRRCAWVRLSTTQVRRMRLMEAWRRDRRGAGSVVQVQVLGQRGEAARPGARCPTCVFSSLFRSDGVHVRTCPDDDDVTQDCLQRAAATGLITIHLCLKCDYDILSQRVLQTFRLTSP